MSEPSIGPVDRLQRRHPVLGFPIAVVYKFFDDFGGYLCALLTYYGFLSLFLPIILLYTAWVFRVMRGTVSTESLNKNPNAY